MLKSFVTCAAATIALSSGVAMAGELQSFRNNAELERYLEDIAIVEMEKQVENPPVYRRFATANAAAGGGATHTTTNVQVAGVDEPDFVKNDAEHVYKLAGESLVIVDAAPAWNLRELSRTKIEGWPHAMFLSGKTVIVFSNAPAPAGMERPQPTFGGWWGGPVRMMAMPIWGGGSQTVVKATQLDVTRPGAPRVTREYYLEGNFVDARMVGTEVHLVTSARPAGPVLEQWQDWSRQPTTAEVDALKTENRRRIRNAPLSDFIPRELVKTSGARPRTTLRASKTFRPTTPEGRNLLSVTSFDVATSEAPQHAAVIGEAGEIYASEKNLYVASYRWRYWSETGVGQEPGDLTEIHQFRVGLASGPRYDGTGEVPGHVLNQFAMDEWNGMLRVATTTEAGVGNGQPQKNHVFVLKRFASLGRKLWQIGSIRDIAPNERIYSTRFLGERGFVVTFRQVDPLFAIDMRKLEVKGELKVDGFSTYLHPVGAKHLLAVGNAADPQTGRVTGLDISLFDVSDLSAPKLAHRRTLAGAYSQSLYEHKAFTYFAQAAEAGVLMIPVSDWQNGGAGFSGLEVHDVSVSGGISLRGRIDHGGMARSLGWTWAPEVSRSAVIGRAIFSFSDVGVKTSRLVDPSRMYDELIVQP